MTHADHLVYLLTQQNDAYRDLIVSSQLDGFRETQDRTQATIVLASPPIAATCLHEFPKLQWLQSIYAGVDALMAPELPRHYHLTNIKGIFGQFISEYVIGQLINHYRHFPDYQAQQRQQQWHPRLYRSLAGETMTILGTGAIGSHLSQVASAFHLKTVGVNRHGISPAYGTFSQIYPIHELTAALSNAQIIVNTLPATPETDHLLNETHLSVCNQAILLNVGRGQTLDEAALLKAIEAGHIQHAYLDVFDQEPLSEAHPFWRHPQITVTPHIAATSFPEQVIDTFAINFQRWQAGDALLNRVDFEKGY